MFAFFSNLDNKQYLVDVPFSASAGSIDRLIPCAHALTSLMIISSRFLTHYCQLYNTMIKPHQ